MTARTGKLCRAPWPYARWIRASLFGSALTVGCSLGGQTGSEETNTAGDGPCETRTTALAPDQTTPLGFTLAELSANVSGTFSSSMLWGESSSSVDFGPAHGPSTLSLTITPRGGGRLLHYESKPKQPITVGCPLDAVELDAEVQLHTLDGALDETFVATLRATTVDSAELQAQLDLAKLAGSFFATLPAGSKSSKLMVRVTLAAGGFSGALSGQIEETRGDSVGASQFTYACWPEENGTCTQGQTLGR